MKVVNLDLAKELKKNGYPQDAEFNYYSDNYGKEFTIQTREAIGHWYPTSVLAELPIKGVCSAPSADEILDLLPWRLDFGDGLLKFLVISKIENGFEVGYQNDKSHGYVDGYTSGVTIADALAKMWLYVKERKFID